jgi:hypothetical protein
MHTKIEVLTILKYFKKEKSKRFADFVMKEKRQKFISALAHSNDLDYSKFQKINNNVEEVILEKQKKYKIENCYVISENKKIDGKYLTIAEAIGECIGYGMGTLLVFGSADFVYYEGEEMNDRWISK